MDEQKDLIRGTLTFLNGRIYKGDIVLINGEFRGIIELSDGSYYPVFFIFSKGECIDFNLIEDDDLSVMLNRGYKQKFGINPDKKPFNKEEILKLFNFDEYKKNGSNDVHIAIQHRIGNYDGDSIGFMPEGNGILTYKNGDVYEGEFKKGIPEGKGKLTFGKYGKMQGEFKDGMLNGDGISYYPNRGEYEGKFKDGKPDGYGIVVYSNGDIYEGEFGGGKPDGYGKLIRTTGEVIEGKFSK